MKIIFKNIHNKIKLKIIKHNKYILQRLDIKKEDFKIYETFKEFTEKLNIKIIDIDIKELDLRYENIGNKGLELFKNMKFKELEILDLSNNEISDIKALKYSDFNKLKKLLLNYNKISDIKVLENANFKDLELLDLSNNKISDIKH